MSHISYSELKTWKECPFKHKLAYVDRLKGFRGNEYTAFGTSLHSVCELVVESKYKNKVSYAHDEIRERFNAYFKENIRLLREDGVELNSKMISEMFDQALGLLPIIVSSLEEHFGEFELIATEEMLMEEVKEFSDQKYDFKGFIDLVLKTEDGKYHIIDWKTCSWGWDVKRKFDSMTTYQLTLYKHYFAAKHDIDPENIETHFALLKRTATKNRVEIFKVTSGERKTQNALNLLTKALHNITKGNRLKNRLSCSRCDFHKTEHCP